MEISGKYKKDQNFITIYSDNTIYTIARNTGEWGSRSVGDQAYIGGTITQEAYDMWESECEYEGTFTLEERTEEYDDYEYDEEDNECDDYEYDEEYDEYEDEEYDEDEEGLE